MTTSADLRRHDREPWREIRACIAAQGLGALDGHPDHWPRLLAAARDSGDPWYDEAWDLLVVGLHPALAGAAAKLATPGRAMSPRDLRQETFHRAIDALPRFVPPDPRRVAGALTRWVLAIQQHVFLDDVGSKRVTSEVTGLVSPTPPEGVAAAGAGGADAWVASQTAGDPAARVLVRQLTAELSPHHRSILVMCVVEGRTHGEIATLLTDTTRRPWTEDAVESELRRILKKLAGRLAQDDPKAQET